VYKIIGSDQKQYGPISADQLHQWLKEGRVNRQTSVQIEGATDWKSLGVLSEFSEDSKVVNAPPVMSGGGSDSGVNVIIPYKNVRALVAYYLAVFSLIPFFGLFLGIAAFVLGILGLRFRRNNPAAGGAAHAWIGILLGGLCGFGYLALTIFVIVAAASKR